MLESFKNGYLINGLALLKKTSYCSYETFGETGNFYPDLVLQNLPIYC